MSNDGWSVVRIKVPLKARIDALAKAEGVSTAAWIDRALDAALSGPDGGRDDGTRGDPVPTGISHSAPRRASGERARPAAAAGGGTDQPPPGLGHASSAQVKRGVKPIPKAKR
jgi:hypothetical protein